MSIHRSLAPAGISLTLAFSMAAQAMAQPPDNIPDLVETILPATVAINVSAASGRNASPPPYERFFEEFFNTPEQGPPPGGNSMGSGFIIDGEECFIVTNNHVIEMGGAITVTLPDDRTFNATLVGTDEMTDIAVLKCDAEETLAEVRFADSDQVRIGQWTLAIGNPLGLSHTVTQGMVSQVKREIGIGPYDDFIQTDASINQGNSGGALFNRDGEVIGVNTLIMSPTGASVGLGFAVASNLAQPIAAHLIEYGEVRRGWLGVSIQPVDMDTAAAAGLDRPRGALVMDTAENGPAEAAGLQAGDIILKFNDRDILRSGDLPRVASMTPIGSDAEVTILRDGEETTLTVTLGDLNAMLNSQPTASGQDTDTDDNDAAPESAEPQSEPPAVPPIPQPRPQAPGMQPHP